PLAQQALADVAAGGGEAAVASAADAAVQRRLRTGGHEDFEDGGGGGAAIERPQRFDDVPGPLVDGRVAGTGGGQVLRHFREEVRQGGDDDVLLALEVILHRARRKPAVAGDVAHR